MTPQQRNQRRQLSADLRRASRVFSLRMVKSQQEPANSLNGVSFGEMMAGLGRVG